MSATVTARPAIFEGIKVIDADTHLSESHDLWTRRAPPALRERVPQVRTIDGQPCWVVDRDKLIGSGKGAHATSALAKDGSKPPGMWFRTSRIEDVHPGCYETKARLQLMDEMGIWAQIVYPNTLGFGGEKCVQLDDPLRLAITAIFNDAMAEMQVESGQRLFPMALLPWWDVGLAVREAERCQKMGLRGVNINHDPHYHPGLDGKLLPDLGDAYWNPLWEICTHYNLPVNFHIGASEASMNWYGSLAWPSMKGEGRRMCVGSTMLYHNNGRVMANIICSGLLDRHPELQFVSVESGLGWIPFELECLDYQMKEFEADFKLERSAWEYFARNFYATFWFEAHDKRLTPHLIRALGVDRVMFETDVPHPTCFYPNPLQRAEATLSEFDAASRRQIMSANAARAYSIPV
jgi:predicted TIM-barrel fold metal-dependent hydrolase